MFKVELEFDKTLPKETVNSRCNQIDEIFEGEGVSCVKKSFGERVYIDETDDGFSNIGAALILISDNNELYRAVQNAYWYKNDKCENLMETFFYDR